MNIFFPISLIFSLIIFSFQVFSQYSSPPNYTDHDFEFSIGVSVFPSLNDIFKYRRHMNDNINFNLQGKARLVKNIYGTVGLFNFKAKQQISRDRTTQISLYKDHRLSAGFRIGFEQQFEGDKIGFYHGPSFLYMRDQFTHEEYFTYRERSTKQDDRYRGLGYTLGFSYRISQHFSMGFQIEPSYFNVRYNESITNFGMNERFVMEENYFTMNNNLLILLILRL